MVIDKEKEKKREYQREYYEKNKEKILAKARYMWQKNKGERNAYHRNWINNRKRTDPEFAERLRTRTRNWHRENKDELNTRRRKRWKELRNEWIKKVAKKFGGLVCQHCGFSGPIDAFDFHHIKPKEKENLVCHMMNKIPTKERLAILDKVLLLCATCHRMEHYNIRRKTETC